MAGYLDCFYLLALLSNATNIHVHVFVEIDFHSFWVFAPGIELMGHLVTCWFILYFYRDLALIFHIIIYYLYLEIVYFRNVSHSFSHWPLFHFYC